MLIHELLKKSCFAQSEIMEADNGKTALEILEKERVDLLLSDWLMPDLNGKDLIRMIRQNPELKDISIIMITKEKTIEKMEEALALDIDNFMGKPFTLLELERKIFNTQAAKKYFGWKYSLKSLQRKIFKNKEFISDDGVLE